MTAVLPVIRPKLGDDEIAAVADVLRSGWIAQGPQVARFEDAFAARVGAAHAVAVSSCTAALHLALVTAGIGPGDEVIVPSLSFIATTNAVTYVGARPCFADVDPVTLAVTPATVAAAATPRTAAVVVVHQAGVPADVAAIDALAACWGWTVIEDAACAAGSTYRGHPVGGGPDVACFSFHPRKLLTTGEGGMLTTPDGDLASRLRSLREHGTSASAAQRHASGVPVLETYDEIGFNYRMTDLQAAVGLVQLGRLDDLVERRRELAMRYHELLAALRGVRAVHDPPYGATNYQSFWVELSDAATRDAALRALVQAGIAARRGIMAAHLEAPYRQAGFSLPVTERITRRTLILPLFDELTFGEQDRVVRTLRSAA